MRPNVTWTGLLLAAALSGADLEDARARWRFTTLRKVLDFAVILPLLVCALVITVAVLGFTVLVARLLSASIAFLERLNTAYLFGKTRT